MESKAHGLGLGVEMMCMIITRIRYVGTDKGWGHHNPEWSGLGHFHQKPETLQLM